MPRGRKKKDGLDPQGWKGADEQTPSPSTEGAVTVHSQTGPSQTVVPATAPAPPPAIVLPPAEEALSVLQGLAEQNQRVQTARRRLEEAQGTVKARRSTLEAEQEVLEEMLRKATQRQPGDLPLFDAAERERDLAAMQEQAAAPAPEAQDERSEDPEPDGAREVPFVAPEPSLADPLLAPVVEPAPAEVF